MQGKRLTIRFALIALLLVSVVPMGVALGVSAYLNSSKTVRLLWEDLATELVGNATEKALRFFEPGPGQLRLHRAAVDDGSLELSNETQLVATLTRCIRAQPSISWCSWGGADGSYVAAYRTSDGELRTTVRRRSDGQTLVSDRVLDQKGRGGEPKESRSDFDPRTRPWWTTGRAATTPTWAEPFLFASKDQPGVVLTLRQDDQDGEFEGVWLAEYELSHISAFLHRMQEDAAASGGPFAHARAYILDETGRVIGHPDGQVSKESQGARSLIRASEHPDDALRLPFLKSQTGNGELAGKNPSSRGVRHFALGRPPGLLGLRPPLLLAVTAPFPDGGPSWSILVSVPSKELLAPVFANNRRAAGLAALITLLSVIVGIAIADRFVRPLSRVARDLELIGKLELPDAPEPARSVIREVSEMLGARDQMTHGLRSFSKYVPAKLVRQLMAQGQEATLGGETRELTVYFSDIAGFTSIAERLSPEGLVDALADYLGEMSDIIHEELGTVDKYIGDAIMAFWGAPQPVDNHALRACRAALRCQSRLDELRADYRAKGLPTIHARIGLNSGDCLVGNIGSAKRMNYTVMGDPVNVASRLEGQCKPYEVPILIGERTAELAGEAIVARPIDKIAVKGKDQGIVVYELMGLREDSAEEDLLFVASFKEGFNLYLAGDFRGAQKVFDLLSGSRQADVPLRLLAERCQHYLQSPPETWDGVMRLQTK